MTMVIVPNALAEAIFAKVDAQLELVPELKPERENIFNDLLGYYDTHGVIPDFSLEKK